MGDEKAWVVKCSQIDCQHPATWKTGTWWLCDQHARLQLTGAEYDAGEGMLCWGTTRKVGMCLASDYYLDGKWEGLAVKVAAREYEVSHG